MEFTFFYYKILDYEKLVNVEANGAEEMTAQMLLSVPDDTRGPTSMCSLCQTLSFSFFRSQPFPFA